MENKITLSVLAQMLSERTGSNRKECEDLLRSFFRTISATLAAGEPVKVRGFGTFKISAVDARMSVDVSSGQDYEIPAHNRIVFIPAKELAGMVNAPFSMFETIELADALTDADLEEAEEETEETAPQPEPKPEAESETDSQPDPELEEEATPAGPAAEVAPATDTAPAEDSPESYEIASDDEEEEDEEEEESSEARLIPHPAAEEANLPEQHSAEAEKEASARATDERARSRFGHGFIWGMVAAVLLIILAGGLLYLFNDSFHSSVNGMGSKGASAMVENKANATAAIPGEGDVAMATDMAEVETGLGDIVEDQPEEKEIPADSTVPTRPSDQPVYDTVTASAGLGVLARKHYGNYHFWPYIYKENEKIIGHPDRIRPGTRLVIPPLSKYGVDPRRPEDLVKAKRLDAEIYARYKAASKKN